MVFKFILPVETQTSINQGLESHCGLAIIALINITITGSQKTGFAFSNISTPEITHNILSDYINIPIRLGIITTQIQHICHLNRFRHQ